MCNFVHHCKQTGQREKKKEKETWATSFGESLAGRDFEVVADEEVDDGEAEEGGVHPQDASRH